MSERELVGLLSLIRVAYPRFYLNITMADTKSTVTLWYEIFKDDNSQDVTRAVKELITELEFPPTIADVKKKIEKYENDRRFIEQVKKNEEKEKQERLMLEAKYTKNKEEAEHKVNVDEHLQNIRKIMFGG